MFRIILDLALIGVGILVAQRIGAVSIFIGTELKTMQDQIDALKSSVSRQTAVIASASALLSGLSAQIRENADDPEELRKLAEQLDQQTDQLARSVAENTNAAGEIPAAPSKIAGTDTAVGQAGSNGGGEDVKLDETIAAASGAGIVGRTEGDTLGGPDPSSARVAVGTGDAEARDAEGDGTATDKPEGE